MLRRLLVAILNQSDSVLRHGLRQGPDSGLRALSILPASAASDSNAVKSRRHTAAEHHPQESSETACEPLLASPRVAGTGGAQNEASAAAVLVRDSSSLKPRLLRAPPPPAAEPQASNGKKKPADAACNNGDAPAELPAESELQYFTADAALDAGFAAAQSLQDKAITNNVQQLPAARDTAASAAGAHVASAADDRSAALSEMQQLQELCERHGGVLAPEDLEVVQVAKQRAARKLLPMEALASAITNALQVGKKYGVDPKVLLTPRIADMRTDLLQARAAQIKRMLPDTQLQEELLARGAEEVSGKITRIITTFRKQLGMDAPVQMLTQPGTFAKALRLPDDLLEHHLSALQRLVASKVRARQLANMFANTVFSRSFPAMLKRVDRVAAALHLTQVEAVEMVLRYPFLARTNQQLIHMEQMVQSAPSALRLSEQQLLPCFTKHPELFMYSGINGLAQKYHALAEIMQVSNSHHKEGAQGRHAHQTLPADLLYICSSSRVRQAGNISAIAESLRTATAIMGYKSPAELLPMLLQQPKGKNKGHVYGAGRRPLLVALLMPAETLAARAGFVQQQLGLSREQVAQYARWFTIKVFCSDIKTRKLKHALLQGQLLGTEIMADDQLDPRMMAVFRKSPLVNNMQVDTALQRIHSLETVLQLQPGQAKQIVLRLPKLLSYNPTVLQELVQLLMKLLGGNLEPARKLVLREPKVLLLLSQYRSGSLRTKLVLLQRLLHKPQLTEVHAELPHIDAAAATAAAVKAAAARVASSSHGMTGVRRRPSGSWECRSYLVFGKSKQYSSHHDSALEAACAQDLIRLALKGPGAAVNLSEGVYTTAEVEAMAANLRHKRRQWQQQQQQQLMMTWQQPTTQSPTEKQQQAGAADTGQLMLELPAAGLQHHQQQARDLETLFIRCLATEAGRQLLTCRTETAEARLQTLADLLGLSVGDLLQKALTNHHYLQGVLSMSPGRMEAAAADLQQQLDLSLPQLQNVLRGAPQLLLYKQDVLKDKIGVLVQEFANTCWVLQQLSGAGTDSVVDSSSAGRNSRGSGVDTSSACTTAGPQEPVMLDAVTCLQQAVTYAPQLLGLKAEGVARRLQVLQDVCCNSQAPQDRQQSDSLVQQLQEALQSGRLGRWLISSDTIYEALPQLMQARKQKENQSTDLSISSSSRRRGGSRNSSNRGTGASSGLNLQLRLQEVLRMSSASVEALVQGLLLE